MTTVEGYYMCTCTCMIQSTCICTVQVHKSFLVWRHTTYMYTLYNRTHYKEQFVTSFHKVSLIQRLILIHKLVIYTVTLLWRCLHKHVPYAIV